LCETVLLSLKMPEIKSCFLTCLRFYPSEKCGVK